MDAFRFPAVLLLALVFLASCTRWPKRIQGWGVQVSGWSESHPGVTPVPGIDSASVCRGTSNDGAVFALWTDGRAGSSGSSWDKAKEAAHFESTSSGSDGRRVQVHCYSKDGKTGELLVEGQSFQLENGALFLIDVNGPKTVVRQLNRNLGDLPTDSGALREMAQRDPEISEFFRKAVPATKSQ